MIGLKSMETKKSTYLLGVILSVKLYLSLQYQEGLTLHDPWCTSHSCTVERNKKSIFSISLIYVTCNVFLATKKVLTFFFPLLHKKVLWVLTRITSPGTSNDYHNTYLYGEINILFSCTHIFSCRKLKKCEMVITHHYHVMG